MIPTLTQQAREATAAKERAEKEEKRKSAILTSSSNLGDGAIVFSDEGIDEEDLKEKNIVLFPKEEEGGVAEDESVTMTFTITDTTTPHVNVIQKDIEEVPKKETDVIEEALKKETNVLEEVPKKETDVIEEIPKKETDVIEEAPKKETDVIEEAPKNDVDEGFVNN